MLAVVLPWSKDVNKLLHTLLQKQKNKQRQICGIVLSKTLNSAKIEQVRNITEN